MSTLLLIRHGENDFLKQGLLPGQLPGIFLNERGQAQAAALAEGLKGLPVKAIYASPLERAVETAEPLARALNLDIQLRPNLMDANVGEWAGKEIKKLRKLALWKQNQEQPAQARFPGGETVAGQQERIVAEINSISAAHKKEMVAVVFHADPIKLAIGHYIGLPLDKFQKMNIDPGSVSILEVGPRGAQLVALNLKPPFSFPNS